MPRVGLAYSPGKSGKTSIRAGFGINYDVLYDNLGLLSLPPEITTTVDVTGESGQGFLAGGGIAPNASRGASDSGRASGRNRRLHPEPDAAEIAAMEPRHSARVR